MMRLFFIVLCSLSLNSFSQDSTQVREISDSCIFVRNTTASTFNAVTCLDNQFRVYMVCPIAHFSIRIYDRWGEQLFFTNDIDAIWVADHIADGVYVWHVQGKVVENDVPIAVEKMGHVVVLK